MSAEQEVVLPELDVQEFDPQTDTIVIEGMQYSGAFFRDGFGSKGIPGGLRIDRGEDGVVTVTRLSDLPTNDKAS